MHKKNKRGALELSVNTIIIVVIGITLLVLGLGFIKGLFGELTQLKEDIFEQVDVELGRIDTGEKLDVVNLVSLEQGKTKVIKAKVYHDGSAGDGKKNFRIEIVPGENFDEKIVKAVVIAVPVQTLDEGEVVSYPIKIAAINTAQSGSYASYKVFVLWGEENDPNPNSEYATSAFAVDITPKTGFFG